jgi:OOP family OmpA-OmpF porin
LAKFSIGLQSKFYHASIGFLSKKGLYWRGLLCLNSRCVANEEKRRDHVKTATAFLVPLGLAVALGLAGCASEPEKPAPAPEPAAKPAPPPPPVAKPAPPPPAPEPKPVAKPEPPKKPALITVTSTELFEFNKTVLTPEARAKLDQEVVARAKDLGSISLVHIDGHADRLGSAQYNQRLSEKRADAVQAYLVSKGFDASRMETLGSGKTNQVKSCPDQAGGKTDRKALIECLAPNRRVVVEIKGMPR